MKRFLLLILAISLTFAAGCSNSSGPPSRSSQIMPLSVGNEWIGQVTHYNAQGISDSTWLDTLGVSKSEVINGETWYYVNSFWFYNGDTSHQWLTARSDGVYSCDSEHFAKAWRLAKYPAKPEDSVVTFDSTFDSLGNGQADGITVDTTNLSVTVPAGTFSCYVYRGFDYYQQGDVGGSAVEPGNYYDAGVGPIQFGYFNPDGTHPNVGIGRTWQLVRAVLH